MASYEIIPWRDSPDFTQTVRLSGKIYGIRGRWNTVHEFWTIDLFDNNGNALLLGQKLVLNTDILARYNNPLLPPGKIYVIDTGNEAQKIERIGRNDIGVTVFLIYEV